MSAIAPNPCSPQRAALPPGCDPAASPVTQRLAEAIEGIDLAPSDRGRVLPASLYGPPASSSFPSTPQAPAPRATAKSVPAGSRDAGAIDPASLRSADGMREAAGDDLHPADKNRALQVLWLAFRETGPDLQVGQRAARRHAFNERFNRLPDDVKSELLSQAHHVARGGEGRSSHYRAVRDRLESLIGDATAEVAAR